jgi:hypothetical protein
VASASIPKLNAASDPAKGGGSYFPTRALNLVENAPCGPNKRKASFARSFVTEKLRTYSCSSSLLLLWEKVFEDLLVTIAFPTLATGAAA